MGQDAGPSTRLLSCAGRSRQEGRPDRQDQTGTGRSAAPGNDIPSPRALPIRREGVRAPVAPADQAVAGSWPDSWGSGEIRFEINLEAVLQPNQHDCASQTEQIICVPPPLASVSKHGVNIKR